MTELLTAAAVLLAWFVFRYERDGRVRDAIESAYATLRAVQHAMVQGRASGQQGWGQAYFEYDYPEDKAYERADKSRDLVLGHNFEQIFVVPTEPLAKLATASPREGLIEYDTVASASFALWNVQKFNQNVRQLTEFYTQHLVEISSEATTQNALRDLRTAQDRCRSCCTAIASAGRGRCTPTAKGVAGTATLSKRSIGTCATLMTVGRSASGSGS
jgi:hypothetical protein